MVAIGADRILMGPTAYLTAVDTSLNHALSPLDRDNDRVSVSLNELQRVIRLWREQQAQGEATPENAYKALFQYVHPLVIGAVDRAESLSLMLCRELLAYHIADEAKAEGIAAALNGKYPSHSYPILLDTPGPADAGVLQEIIPCGRSIAPRQTRVEVVAPPMAARRLRWWSFWW